MKRTQNNLLLLNVLFATCLVIANVVSARLVCLGNLFGTEWIVPGAVFAYAVTYLCTDIITEIWGEKQAKQTVRLGFIAQILASVLIYFTGFLPIASTAVETGEAYTTLLGQNFWFTFGSLASYVVSQAWDVKVFGTVRKWLVSKTGSNKHRWLYNNASTMTSQIWDTLIFIVIAFGFGLRLPWSVVGNMIIAQYAVKFLIAFVDTPFFYFFTRGNDRGVNDAE